VCFGVYISVRYVERERGGGGEREGGRGRERGREREAQGSVNLQSQLCVSVCTLMYFMKRERERVHEV